MFSKFFAKAVNESFNFFVDCSFRTILIFSFSYRTLMYASINSFHLNLQTITGRKDNFSEKIMKPIRVMYFFF